MLQTNLGVQSINNQLDALQAAQDSITNFCTIAHRNLQQYLEQRQVEMDGVAENFVQSWINMFNRIQIHNGENPIAYLKQLSTIDQNISAIVSQKDILYQKLDDLKQLSTIDQNISTIVSQKDILYQKLDDIKDATGKGITGGTQPYRNAEMSNGPTQTEENDETQPANKEPGEGVGGKGGSRFWDWINRKK